MSIFHIISISESYLDKSIDNDQIKLKSFQNPVRLDRNRDGGGVTIYYVYFFVILSFSLIFKVFVEFDNISQL
jgi:hypothetical protein